MSQIQLHDLHFKPYLSADQIQSRISELGSQIGKDYTNRKPLFLCMLRGAFIFAADLIRSCPLSDVEISFVRLASYHGTQSSGQVETFLPPKAEEIAGRDVIIIEDIVDSGRTMSYFLPQLQALQPSSVAIATLLFKPTALMHNLELDYIGFEIPDDFVVGYGLDYDGLGRGLADIYQKA